MKKNIFISVFLFFLGGNLLFAQKKRIKLVSNDSIENAFLRSFKLDSENISKESIISQLQKKGFFYACIDSITTNNKKNITTYFIRTGKRIDSLSIKISKEFQPLSKTIHELANSEIKTSLEEYFHILQKIQDYFESKGELLSTAQLTNINLKEKVIHGELILKRKKQRTIDKIIIRGYTDFPKSFLTHKTQIKEGLIFDKKHIEKQFKTNPFSFASQTQPPEVLFSKDSTYLYLYFKKNKLNSIDGLLNFATNPVTQKLLITGHINFDLVNTLNTGEIFKLDWKANGNNNQNLNIHTFIPYIFNSPLSNTTNFQIHKQDSTFLNTKFKTGLNYTYNTSTEFGLFFETEKSNSTLNKTSNIIKSFESAFGGTTINYNQPVQHQITNTKLFLQFNYQLGERVTESINTTQHKFLFEGKYNHFLNQKDIISLRNKTEFLFSKSYINNELYRIGGSTSIRGLQPESYFTPKYSLINLEYKRITNKDAYLFALTDFAFTENIQENIKYLTSIGAGYSFSINKSRIDFTAAKNLNNIQGNQGFSLALSFKNYF